MSERHDDEQGVRSAQTHAPVKNDSSRLARVARTTGRTVAWPFKNSLRAPLVNVTRHDQVWDLDHWQSLIARALPVDRSQDIAELDARERWWADPRNWPLEVVQFVRYNIQLSALLYLGLLGLSLFLVFHAGTDSSLDRFSRICLLFSGVMGLGISSLLYLGTCLDYARISYALNIAPRHVFLDLSRYWVFESAGEFLSFWLRLPRHILLSIKIRQRKRQSGHRLRMLVRAALVIAGMTGLFAAMTYISYLLSF